MSHRPRIAVFLVVEEETAEVLRDLLDVKREGVQAWVPERMRPDIAKLSKSIDRQLADHRQLIDWDGES